MASKAARDRYYFASKLWRGGNMPGWASPHWDLTKKEEAALAFFIQHKHVEENLGTYRLTDAGRAALQEAGR